MQIRLTKIHFVLAATATLIHAGQVLAEEESYGAVSEQAKPDDVLAVDRDVRLWLKAAGQKV